MQLGTAKRREDEVSTTINFPSSYPEAGYMIIDKALHVYNSNFLFHKVFKPILALLKPLFLLREICFMIFLLDENRKQRCEHFLFPTLKCTIIKMKST